MSELPLVSQDISFKLLVDNVRDYAIFMLDPRGTVMSWNPGAERINGYRAEEIIGRHFSVFYPEEDVAAGRPECELRTARDTGRYEEESWRVRKDGSRYRVHVVVTTLHDAQGRFIGFAKVTQDITDRWETEQALQQSEERLRILVDQIEDYAIFMLDPDGRIATWNQGAQRIKGYTAKEVIGRPLSLFYTAEDQSSGHLIHLLRRADAQGVAHDIGWRVRRDGSRFWADVTLTALRNDEGDLYGYAKVLRDLTERVEAEEQARAYEAAQEAIQLRDEFLSIAAHELRTPLTAGQLQLQGLQRYVSRDATTWNPKRIQSGLDLAIRSTGRLAELVETLLDVSRITTGRIRLTLEDFDLVTACREAIERLDATIREAGCEVRFTAPDELVGRWDLLRVEQVLMNLLSNACKYAPHTTIEVGLERLDEQVRLWVSDQGPGISQEDVERIFGRFERAVSAAHYGGLGLGLYVTRQIVDLHGGTIQVISRPEQGSTFNLFLPLHTAPRTADA